MPAQRTTASVPADRRSAFPHLSGLGSLGAVLIAVTATLTGFAIEAGAGHQELGAIFALCYAAGCFGAVLLVRQSCLFTAVIQPPLLLFAAVPLSYFLLHGSESGGLKNFLINCGYPLIERFPLMLFTSATVLLIGLVRWYLATPGTASGPARQAADEQPVPAAAGLLGSLSARLRSGRGPKHGIDRSGGAPASARVRPEQRPARGAAGPRRQSARRPARDSSPAHRRQPTWDAEPPRRSPRERREPYPRPRRGGGYESRGYYPPYEPQYPARSRQQPPAAPRGTGSHHPVSRVRYRGDDRDYPDYPAPRGAGR